MYRSQIYHLCLIIILILTSYGCASQFSLPYEKTLNVYTVNTAKNGTVSGFAPVFLARDYRNTYNRIGRPSAKYTKNGREQIYIDTEKPVIYYMVRNFSTEKDNYTNYIYRVHFPAVPFSLIPFHLSAGKNTGLIIVVTVDSEKRPVLVTTVHTCGCYLAIVPTSYLSPDAYPVKWKSSRLKVYGETLPRVLVYSEKKDTKLVVHLRPGEHRVMDLDVIEEQYLLNTNFHMIYTPLAQMKELEKIPINGKTTSFYHDEGPLKGHVKGSIKLWETILLSPISMDLFVGTDKDYSDTNETGNTFYTSLKPWNRYSSDMGNFKRFLKFWGWRL